MAAVPASGRASRSCATTTPPITCTSAMSPRRPRPMPRRCRRRPPCPSCWREIRFVQNAPAARMSTAVLGLVPARGGSKGVPGQEPAAAGRTLAARLRGAGGRGVRRDRPPRAVDRRRRDCRRRAARPASRCRSCARRSWRVDETPMLPVIEHALAALADGRLAAGHRRAAAADLAVADRRPTSATRWRCCATPAPIRS